VVRDVYYRNKWCLCHNQTTLSPSHHLRGSLHLWGGGWCGSWCVYPNIRGCSNSLEENRRYHSILLTNRDLYQHPPPFWDDITSEQGRRFMERQLRTFMESEGPIMKRCQQWLRSTGSILMGQLISQIRISLLEVGGAKSRVVYAWGMVALAANYSFSARYLRYNFRQQWTVMKLCDNAIRNRSAITFC